MSEHFQLGENVVQRYLERKNMMFKVNINFVVCDVLFNSVIFGIVQVAEDKFNLRDCPTCHDTKDKPDNIWKLYIFQQNGNAFCHRCGLSCNWFDFQQQLGDLSGRPPKLAQDEYPTIQSRSQPKGNGANSMTTLIDEMLCF